MRETREERQSLWWLTIGPSVWFAHFLLSYITASVWCSKALGSREALGPVPAVLLAYTAVALAAIGLVAWSGWRRHTFGEEPVSAPHDADTPEDRHRFLGLATLLLAGLSGVAVIYVAAASTIFFETCR